MTVRWDGSDPPALRPLTGMQRARLIYRGVWAATSLVFLFSIFLIVRSVEWLLGKLTGRRFVRTSAQVVKFWARLALPTLGLRYVQKGVPSPFAGALVANHSSWIDVVVLQRASAPFLVSKSEVRSWPGIGLIGRAIGTLFIDRKVTAAKAQENELRDRIAAGDQMALFPEGTSTDGLRLLPFKSSLFSVFFSSTLEHVQVQPVSISYVPALGMPEDFYSWWGNMGFAMHLKDVLARSRGGVVKIVFLDTVSADTVTGRKEMALVCDQRIRAAFRPQLPSEEGSKVSATPFMQ
ncbi:MAG: lysophospholipid acyltransferase family protein [Pseudomonadota bacterium]